MMSNYKQGDFMSGNASSCFVLNKNEAGDIYFTFLNSVGEIVLISGFYDEKSSAEEAINEVKKNSLISQQLAAGRAKDGGQFFVIKGSDSDILVKSALYTSQMVMDNALHCVKDNACVAEVVDKIG